jgi:hypothetical protein
LDFVFCCTMVSQGKGRRKGVLYFCEHFGVSEESAPH